MKEQRNRMNLFGSLIFSSSISSHFTTCLLIFILHFSPQLPSNSNKNSNRNSNNLESNLLINWKKKNHGVEKKLWSSNPQRYFFCFFYYYYFFLLRFMCVCLNIWTKLDGFCNKKVGFCNKNCYFFVPRVNFSVGELIPFWCLLVLAVFANCHMIFLMSLF